MSSGIASVEQKFHSPDLLAMKQKRQNATKQATNEQVGPNGKKLPFKIYKTQPGFSLQLIQAVQELKDKEDEEGQEDGESANQCKSTTTSQVRRNKKYQAVANETKEHLKILEEIQQEQQEFMTDSYSTGYQQEDSSQLQSFVNSPDVIKRQRADATQDAADSQEENDEEKEE